MFPGDDAAPGTTLWEPPLGDGMATGGRADTLQGCYHTLVSPPACCDPAWWHQSWDVAASCQEETPTGGEGARAFPWVLSPLWPFSENELSPSSGSSLTAKPPFLRPGAWMLSSA